MKLPLERQSNEKQFHNNKWGVIKIRYVEWFSTATLRHFYKHEQWKRGNCHEKYKGEDKYLS